MRKYKVIEDNGGGLTLVVFGENGEVKYLCDGYQFREKGSLINDINALKNGEDPSYWDGNVDDPQAAYDEINSFDFGFEVVADEDGIYPNKMGVAASLEFGIDEQ